MSERLTANDVAARVPSWVEAGIIEQPQADAIMAYEASVIQAGPGAAVQTHDRVVGGLGTLGGLLVGLGVLLTVAANWSGIGDTTKLVIIILAMVVAYGAALAADTRGAVHWIGSAGYTVGTLVFGGGIFLLGQVYNVQAHDPLGFLVLAITASIVAVLSARRIVGVIAAGAWIAWAVHELFTALDRASDEEQLVAVFGAGAMLGIAALGLGWILDGIAARAAAGTIRSDLSVLGTPFRGIAQLGLLGLLVPTSFAWHLDNDSLDGSASLLQVGIWLVLAVVSAVLVTRLSVLRTRVATGIMLGAAAVVVLVAVLALNPFLAGLFANLLLAVGGISLAWMGLVEDRPAEYAQGVAWILILIAARYVDMLVTTELGGFGFIGAGLLFIGLAWLAGRSRRFWQERDA